MSYRRATYQARRGTAATAAATLLLYVAASAASAAASGAAGWPCDALSAVSPWKAPSVWWEAGGSYFAQLRSYDGALRLRSVLRLYPLAQREVQSSSCAGGDGGAVAQVCVALVDTTAYTGDGAQENAAWVTLHTDPLLPVAVVEVDAACWARERSSLSRCRPCVLAPSQVQQLPLYHHSPLSRAFWAALNASAMPRSPDQAAAARRPWLHRINMQANANRSARAEWLRLTQLPALRGLELTGNAWADGLPQLPALPALGELRLHNNHIAALPDDFLSGSPLLEMLILARNSLTHLPRSITNMKMLRLLDVTNPLPLGQSFSIEYISQLPNLRILGLENQKLVGDVMPILMMPSLMFLNMSGCGLEVLGNIRNFPLITTDLQVLDLSYNNLEVVTNSILSRFPKLTKLLLNGNNLRTMGDESSMSKLDYLDISQNHLKSLPRFQSNSQLKTLKAHDNALENFIENFWESFPMIEVLDLSQNHLTEVPVLMNQMHLQNLDLSKNEIKILHGLSFGQMRNLKSIDLSNNLLTTVDANVFKNFQELKIVDLSHNRLWDISLVSESLELIDLSYNLLMYMPVMNTPSLYHLSLKQNLITAINFTFVNSSKLRELDVSWNMIKVADLGNLTLDTVDLSHNALKYMPTDSFGTQQLNVEGNAFNGGENEKETTNDMWDSWFIWTLGGIAALALITAVLLVGVAILVRKLMKRNEPLVLSSTCRSPSPVSFNEPPAVRFK